VFISELNRTHQLKELVGEKPMLHSNTGSPSDKIGLGFAVNSFGSLKRQLSLTSFRRLCDFSRHFIDKFSIRCTPKFFQIKPAKNPKNEPPSPSIQTAAKLIVVFCHLVFMFRVAKPISYFTRPSLSYPLPAKASDHVSTASVSSPVALTQPVSLSCVVLAAKLVK